MATKQWTHLKLKNGDEVQWIPPAPNGANRGGVTTTEMNAKQNATDNALNTTNKTVVGAINEHESDISTLSNDIANKETKGKITINSTEYTVIVSTTDSGTDGYITFVVEN